MNTALLEKAKRPGWLRAVRRRLGTVWRTLVPPPRPIARLHDHFALTKTIYGHKIMVDTRDLSLSPHILLDGYWELWLTQVFLQLLRPGMHVLDIGANLGYYALLAASSVGESGHVYCFEANPDMADLTLRNLLLNGFRERSTVVGKALYSENTRLTFNVHEKYRGSSSLWQQTDELTNTRDQARQIEVETIRLDDYFAPGSRVDLIKLDAEGAEAHIFAGATRLLRENPQLQIIMEFAPALLRAAGSVPEQLYQQMHDLGFSVYRLEHDASLTRLDPKVPPLDHHCDLYLRRETTGNAVQ